MAELTAAGLGSGLDIKSLVDQLVAAERQPVNDRLNLAEARVNREISSVGKVKNALAAFKDVLAKLSDLDKFQQRAASVSAEETIAVTASSKAVPASYSIEVGALATRQKVASQTFADVQAPIGWGTLTITIDGEAFAVDVDAEAMALVDVRDAINDAASGVEATIITTTDGARLVLTSRETGANQEFSIAASGGDGGLAVFDYSTAVPGTYSVVTSAADASLTIDGFAVTSSGNTVSDAIEGVTIELLAANPGEPATFEISFDRGASRDILANFVAAYNALANTIKKETEFDFEAGLRGALLGDSTTRGIQSSLRRELSRVVGGAGLSFSTLAEIGIVTTLSGTLEIDASRLDAAFASDFDGIGRLFANEDGIGSQMLPLVERFLDSDGQIKSRQDRLRARLDDIGDDRERLEQRIETVRRRLELQFNAMDLLVSQLNTTSQFLAQQLG